MVLRLTEEKTSRSDGSKSELSDVWSEDSLDKWNIKGKALGWEPPDSERLRKVTEASVAEAERARERVTDDDLSGVMTASTCKYI